MGERKPFKQINVISDGFCILLLKVALLQLVERWKAIKTMCQFEFESIRADRSIKYFDFAVLIDLNGFR